MGVVLKKVIFFLSSHLSPVVGDSAWQRAVDVERLCRVEGGRDAVVAGAGGGSALVATLVCAMSGCTTEHAAGALVAVVGSSKALQVEATRVDAMGQLPLDGAGQLL